MLSERISNLINRHWLWIILSWIVLTIILRSIAPSWDKIAKDGDLDYLPKYVTSLQGKALLEDAFPNERSHSQAVITLSRGGEPLTPDDRRFGKVVSERLANIDGLPLVDIWDESTQVVGDMLLAKDDKAVMVIAQLTNGLMDVDNARILGLVEKMVAELKKEAPEGVDISITGSAIIGGSLRASIEESLSNTETTTVVLVLLCLIAIYRAPLLVLIPLATIAVSMSCSYDVVALLAENFGPDDFEWSDFKIFTTTKIFVVVILFGAGTDYCLFLIARYKEELAAGVERNKAPGQALANVGDALAGSAFTTILGLSTMAFSQYGKFQNSGPIIAVCLFIAMMACVTFAPALLRALGPAIFWPFDKKIIQEEIKYETVVAEGGGLWGWISDLVMKRPVTILVLTAWASLPLIIAGANVEVTHDFMADLDPNNVSVVGAEKVREFYDQGTIAPMKIVAYLSDKSALDEAGKPIDLANPDGRFLIAYLHKFLYDMEPVADVRSFYLPAGGDPAHRKFVSGGGIEAMAAANSPISIETFVSQSGVYQGRVTQLSLILNKDPFSRAARDDMPGIHQSLKDYAAEATINDEPNPWHNAQFELVGVTPGMRDLEVVTNSDRTRIQILTVTAVYLVLIFILKRPVASAYLIVTVLLSYWVTLGGTNLFFEWCYGDTFRGLDWKVPIFLFVILIAVGQDYNIYLATRVFEEQKLLGLRAGLRRAIVQTGGIITSCGVIMAGTFISMATGTLRSMIELGFALALGVILDTFFVRTIVVPCFFAIFANREKDDEQQAEALQAESDELEPVTSQTA